MSNTTIDPSRFSVNKREGEYEARFEVRGEARRTIRANSLKDAIAEANRIADQEEIELYPEEVEEAEVYVRPCSPMFRVTRDGRPMQVSRLEPGDAPREPDERGF